MEEKLAQNSGSKGPWWAGSGEVSAFDPPLGVVFMRKPGCCVPSEDVEER